MVTDGLLAELQAFHSLLHQGKNAYQARAASPVEPTHCSLDFSRGILQSIGFKEFQPYFSLLHQAGITPAAAAAESPVLAACISNMKLNTRRYARKQVQWLRTRILKGNIVNIGIYNLYNYIFIIYIYIYYVYVSLCVWFY
jgi:tRNA A37 N6-isopentenylltransferase MiaA